MMAVAVLANDERMTYSHSGLSMSSTSPFIQHDQDILPGASSVITHFPLVNGHSSTPQPYLELQRPQSKKILESTEPPNNDEHALSSAQWTMTKNKIVTAPYDYLLSKPGKDIRKQVLLAFNDWIHADDESCETINLVVSMLHNASLLVDDIQDNSRLRRGAPSAHSIFGVAQTINSANYVYFLAQQELFRLKQWPIALEIYNEELLNLHRGQGMELYWRDSLTVPTEEEYLEMISNKTGGLFRLALKLMQAVSKTDCNILPLAEVVGLIFQIQDDYKNVSSDQMAAAKGYCEDLTEGKFSFPVIHAIRNSDSGNCEIINILKSRTEDNAVKAHAVYYMKHVTKSFEYTKAFLRQLHDQALSLMDALGPRSSALEAILNKLVMD